MREVTDTIQVTIKTCTLKAGECALVVTPEGEVSSGARQGTVSCPPERRLLVGTKPELQAEIDAGRARISGDRKGLLAERRRDIFGDRVAAAAVSGRGEVVR